MLSRIDFHDLFVRTYVLMVGLTFGLGSVILTGGSERFSGPSFAGPRVLAEPLPWLQPHVYWGLLFLLHGLLLVTALGRQRAVHVLRFGIVVFWFLAFGFVVSGFQQSTAALTGVVAYLVVGSLFLVLSDHVRARGWGM